MASPLSEFVDIGSRTSLYTPANPKGNQLVILCTWLGAARKHIAKFVGIYQNIAPNARILLIQSAVPILISSYVRQRREIQPAASVILDTLAECDSFSLPDIEASDTFPNKPKGKQPKILLHTFSNGGTNTVTQLLIVLRERLQRPLPLAGLLCDSCPAKGEYWKSYDSILFSLPKGFASRILGPPVCHVILILLYCWVAYGNETVEGLIRRTLLDPNSVEPGWESEDESGVRSSAGRVCYLFSKEDRMCHWEDVRDHAIIARDQEWQTQEILFEGSAHCAHLRNDEARYSEAMKGIWDGTGIWRKPFIKV